jgi:hypothetical protein
VVDYNCAVKRKGLPQKREMGGGLKVEVFRSSITSPANSDAHDFNPSPADEKNQAGFSISSLSCEGVFF